MSRRVRRGILAVCAGSAVLALGALALRPPRARIVRLRERDLVQTVVASGRVLAAAEIALRAQAAGRVLAVTRDVGDAVEAGELLVQVDDREARATREQARALVEQSGAQLAQVRRVTARGLGETLRRAELEVEQARRDLGRVEALARNGAATASALDDARHAVALAESRRDLAAIDAEGAAPSGSAVRAAVAAVMQARAALLAADARLSYTRIVAPAPGVITDRRVEVGDVVQLGDTLLTVVRSGPVRLVMEPDERNLSLLAVGQPAEASTEAFPDVHFAARLAFIAPSVDLARGTVAVRFDVPSPPPLLRADMTVSIETEVARRAGAQVLPASAVRDLSGAEPHVLVLEGGRGVKRTVRLGLRDPAWVEIRAGLTPRDDVIDDPQLAPGQRVQAGGG